MTERFEFHHPWALAFLALLPLYALLTGRSGRVSALLFTSVETARLTGAKARSAPGRLLLSLRLFTLAALIVGAAGPSIRNTRTEHISEGVDIMLVFDLSLSMSALDMSPPGEELMRVDLAKRMMTDFIEKRRGDRIGLVAFSGTPHLVSPLTLNREWIKTGVARLRCALLNEMGTAIGDSLAMASDRMKKLTGKGDRVIILLTDGDDNSSVKIDPVSAASLAAGLGQRVYTIGIGRDAPTELYETNAHTGKLERDQAGRLFSLGKMNPANYILLERMAKVANGRFYRAKDAGELERIYDDINRLETSETHVVTHTNYTELFFAFALAALAGLSAEILLANTRHLRLP